MIRIGIDLGGTKIAALALSEEGKELAHQRAPTPRNYESIVRAIADFTKEHEKKTGKTARIGIGTPGAVDAASGMVRFSPNIKMLVEKPFVKDVAAATGREVRIANDAATFALSESTDGAGAGARVVYGVILGTGVGGSLVVDRKISHGPNQLMEWGHLPLPWPESGDVPERCGCGRLGDIESYLSGPALHRQLQKALGREVDNGALQEGLKNNDAAMRAVMDYYIVRLAKAFTLLITVMDPDVIVCGGGVSNLDILYKELPAQIEKYAIAPGVKTRILKARYGDDSGLRGAAWLAG